MKQRADENVYFVILCLSCLFFGLASAVTLILFHASDSKLFGYYFAFASMWALSFAFIWAYFALFSITMGTVFQAAAGILDPTSNNGRIAGYSIGFFACLSVIVGFLALLFRKKWVLIVSLLLVVILTFYYAAEFGWQCFASYGRGRSGIDYWFASISSAAGSMFFCLASIILMIQEIGQIDAEPENLKKIIDDAINGGKTNK